MAKLHFNYDGFQDNGIIFNDAYPDGCMYMGAEYKPSLSFDYHSFGYTEVFVRQPAYVVDVGTDFRRPMTQEEQDEVIEAARAWVQPYGQEGNWNDEQKLEFLKEERNRKLTETDYLALSDNTLTDEMATYRQALRDITNTYSNLDDVVWPTKPE